MVHSDLGLKQKKLEKPEGGDKRNNQLNTIKTKQLN